MKVESTFVIDGKMVKKSFYSAEITVFELADKETLYIVSNNTGEVITRIDMTCEMSQGSGYVDNITYTDMTDE
jgi:glutathionyl-hydroquinone reductase